MSGIIGKNSSRSSGVIGSEGVGTNSVDSDSYVDGSIDAIHLSANSVDSDAYVDGSIDAIHLSANSVDSDAYVDASIDLAHMSSQSVDEDNLHISNSGSNGNFLSKQSGDAGGLTWAAGGGLTADVVEATYDLATAAGTQDITITDFGTIKAVIIVSGVNEDPATCWSMMDGGADSNYIANAHNNAAEEYYTNSGSLVGIYMGSGVYQYCNGSVITDGIRLTWLKGGSPSGTVSIFCMFYK